MTGRDGYLKTAKKDPSFKGLHSMEVCEKDTFKMAYVDGAMQVKEHEIKDFNDRGKIIGAWAKAEFDGQSPIVVYASAAEYKQSNKDVWNRTESAMMRKVPESMALKRGAGISGLVTHEEIEVPDNVSGMFESAEPVDAEYADVLPGDKKMAPKFPDIPDDTKEVIPPAPPDESDVPTVAPPAKKTAKRTNTPVKKDNVVQTKSTTSASKPVTIHELPKGKKLIPVSFPDKLEDYPIDPQFKINVKKFDDDGTHWDVNGSEVWVDGDRCYSDAKGFTPPNKCVHVAVVFAITRFKIGEVTNAYPNVSMFGEE
jgi:hypothetical protein